MLRWDPVLRDSVSRYRACLLVFGVLYTLCFCVALPDFIDEVFTYNLATESSLVHFLSALKDGADGAFPGYALVAYGWEKLFGSSEFSLRLTNDYVFLPAGQAPAVVHQPCTSAR